MYLSHCQFCGQKKNIANDRYILQDIHEQKTANRLQGDGLNFFVV
jgi:hypothetical protein